MQEKVSKIIDPTATRMDWWLARSQERDFPITIKLFEKDFVINRGVFSPEVYPETEFYTKEVLKYIKVGTRFLDMGCGSGVTGVMAADLGAKVLSVDVNPDAVANAHENSIRLGVSENMTVIESDVFSEVPKGSVFDLVYWNIPFHGTESTQLTSLQRAIFDPGYQSLRKFVSGIKEHTQPGSVVLVGTSETLGNNNLVHDLFLEEGINLKEVARTIEDPEAENKVSLELYEGVIV